MIYKLRESNEKRKKGAKLVRLIPINNNFILLHDVKHNESEIRININYVVSYKERDISAGTGTVITCKGSIDRDIAPIFVKESPKEIDNMIATRYILEEE